MEGKKTQRVYVIRHGLRIDDAEPDWISQAERPWDPPLAIGDNRPTEAAKRFQLFPEQTFTIATSPFQRCIETARKISLELRPSSRPRVCLYPGLCEFLHQSTGISPFFDMLTLPQLMTIFPDVDFDVSLVPQWTPDLPADRIKGEIMPTYPETIPQLCDRYVRTFETLSTLHLSRIPVTDVLVLVTHGHGVQQIIGHISREIAGRIWNVEYCAFFYVDRPIRHSVTTPGAMEPVEGAKWTLGSVLGLAMIED